MLQHCMLDVFICEQRAQKCWFYEGIHLSGMTNDLLAFFGRYGELLAHLEVGLRLRGNVNRTAIQAALDALTQRHEALRTRMLWQDPCSGLQQALMDYQPGLLRLQVGPSHDFKQIHVSRSRHDVHSHDMHHCPAFANIYICV